MLMHLACFLYLILYRDTLLNIPTYLLATSIPDGLLPDLADAKLRADVVLEHVASAAHIASHAAVAELAAFATIRVVILSRLNLPYILAYGKNLSFARLFKQPDIASSNQATF